MAETEKKKLEPVTEKRTITYEVVRGLANIIFHTIMPVRFHNKERLERERPYVMIANHNHALDPVPMAMGVKHDQLVFLGKKELGSNRLTRCHVWGGPVPPRSEGELPEMLIDSVNYVLSSYDAILTDC